MVIETKAVELLKEYDIQMWSFDTNGQGPWILKTDKKVSDTFRILFCNLFPDRNIRFEVIEEHQAGHFIMSHKDDHRLMIVEPDNINHPTHYNSGSIEVIEAIEDWKLTYHRGNAVKYIARAGKKDPTKEVEDLEKAAWYLKRDIEKLKAKMEGREAIRPNAMNK